MTSRRILCQQFTGGEPTGVAQIMDTYHRERSVSIDKKVQIWFIEDTGISRIDHLIV
jgi:hypothetical protein